MDGMLSEYVALKSGKLADFTGGFTDAARVSLEDQHKIAVIVEVASAAFDLNIDLKQHDAAAAGNSKVLSISNAYYVKLSADTVFTKVETSDASVTDFNVTNTDFNGDAGILVLEILSEDLDRANDYSHISVDVTQAAGARIGHVLYAGHRGRNLPAYKQTL